MRSTSMACAGWLERGALLELFLNFGGFPFSSILLPSRREHKPFAR